MPEFSSFKLVGAYLVRGTWFPRRLSLDGTWSYLDLLDCNRWPGVQDPDSAAHRGERNNDTMLLRDDAICDLILRLWLGPTHGMEELASLGGAPDGVESGGAMQSSQGRFWFTEGKAEGGRRLLLLKAVFSRVRRQDAESTDSGGPT
jgi:hypothetical protein